MVLPKAVVTLQHKGFSVYMQPTHVINNDNKLYPQKQP